MKARQQGRLDFPLGRDRGAEPGIQDLEGAQVQGIRPRDLMGGRVEYGYPQGDTVSHGDMGGVHLTGHAGNLGMEGR